MLLSFLALGLTGLIALELQPERQDAPLTATQAARSQNAAPGPDNAATANGQNWVDTILARPLFAPDRRPVANVAAAPGGLPSLPRLAGILLDGPRRSVIFAAPGDARPTVVAEGGTLGNFKVQAIEATQVTIMAPDGPHILRPSFDPRPSSPAARPGLPNLSGLTIPGLPPLPVAR